MHKIDTQITTVSSSDSKDEPQSVVLAPDGFKNFETGITSNQQSPTESSENTVVSPDTPEAAKSPIEKVR